MASSQLRQALSARKESFHTPHGLAASPHFQPTRQQRKKPGKGELIWSGTLAGGTSYGWPGAWSQDRIEQVLHYKHWVWKAITARGRYMAQYQPEIGYIKKIHQQKSWVKQFRGEKRYEKTLHAIKPHEEIDYVEDNHPLARLIECPNAWDCWADLSTELDMYWDLTGSAYLWAPPSNYGQLSGTGAPAELWVVPSHWMWPKFERGFGIRYWEVRPFGAGGGILRLPPQEVIYFHDKNPIHKIDGWSPLTAIAEWEDVAERIQTARFWSMENGTFPWGAIELSDQYHDPDDADLERVGAKFYARYGGTQKAGQPMILPPGAKFQPLVITPDKMIFEQSADQMRDWVLAGYDVPKEVAGIQDAGSEIAMYGPLRQFCHNAINPRQRHKGQILTRFLCPFWDEELRLWWADTTPESPEDLRANLDLAARNGWVTPNEGRALLLDMEPFEHGGDDPLIQSGLMPMPIGTGEDLSSLAELMPPEPGDVVDAEAKVESAEAKPEGDGKDKHPLSFMDEPQKHPTDLDKRFKLPIDKLLQRSTNGATH